MVLEDKSLTEQTTKTWDKLSSIHRSRNVSEMEETPEDATQRGYWRVGVRFCQLQTRRKHPGLDSNKPLLCRSIVRLKEEDKEEQKEEIGERRVCRGIGICGQAKVWGLGQMGNENYKEERKGKD